MGLCCNGKCMEGYHQRLAEDTRIFNIYPRRREATEKNGRDGKGCSYVEVRSPYLILMDQNGEVVRTN